MYFPPQKKKMRTLPYVQDVVASDVVHDVCFPWVLGEEPGIGYGQAAVSPSAASILPPLETSDDVAAYLAHLNERHADAAFPDVPEVVVFGDALYKEAAALGHGASSCSVA